MVRYITAFARFVLRWPIRLTIAITLFIVLLRDNPSRLTRRYLDALPDADVVQEANELAAHGAFGEAEYLLEIAARTATSEEAARLRDMQLRIKQERTSLGRRAEAVFKGAITGQADSPEAMAAVLVTDFFLVGDVRDLILEGSRAVIDKDCDEVVLVLSTIGVGTTAGGPLVDAMASFLKAVAKKAKLMPDLATWIIKTLRGGHIDEFVETMDLGAKALRISDPKAIMRVISKCADEKELRRVFEQILELGRLEDATSLLGAMRHVKKPSEVETLTSFAKRNPGNLGAIAFGGPEAIRALERFGGTADELVMNLARKGDKGRAWMRVGPRRLLAPHPIVGLLKGARKGHLAGVAKWFSESLLDPLGSWILAGVLGWLLIECYALLIRAQHRRWWSRVRLWRAFLWERRAVT